MYSVLRFFSIGLAWLAAAFLAPGLVSSTALAALPPGSHESLAAQAPIILVGKVTALENDAGRKLTVFKVLEVGRGQIKPGAVLKVELDQKPKKKIIGPEVRYHKMKPGETWLLFLLPTQGKVVPFHTLAAHGWYTQNLDGIKDAATLTSLLPKPTHRNMEASLSFLREVYLGVGLWLQQGQD